MVESVMSGSASAGTERSLRDVVLAGPGADIGVPEAVGSNPLAVLASRERVRAALTAAGYVDKCQGLLTGAVTTVLVLGLCLYCGQGYASVIGRLWPLLGWFNPVVVLWDPVSAAALSSARARVPAGVLRAVFEAGAVAGAAAGAAAGSVVFGLVLTAVDGTVLDLAATEEIQARFATPSGGRFPQARVVTLVACGTRRVLRRRWTPAGSVSSGCGTGWSPSCGRARSTSRTGTSSPWTGGGPRPRPARTWRGG